MSMSNPLTGADAGPVNELIYDCGDPIRRADGLTAAQRAIAAGELVVLPTDTVYGIAADAFAPPAVARLLAAKHRGRDMPVPVLIGSWHTLDGLVDHISLSTDALRSAFWPGGLTLVVRHALALCLGSRRRRWHRCGADAAAPGRHRTAAAHRAARRVQR